MNIVILAAGLGKRMYSSLPKVLQPVGGKPMLDHVLAAAKPSLTGRKNYYCSRARSRIRDVAFGR